MACVLFFTEFFMISYSWYISGLLSLERPQENLALQLVQIKLCRDDTSLSRSMDRITSPAPSVMKEEP